MASTINPYKAVITSNNQWIQNQEAISWVIDVENTTYTRKQRIKKYTTINDDVITITAKSQEQYINSYISQSDTWWYNQQITTLIHVNKKINTFTELQSVLTIQNWTGLNTNAPDTQSTYDIYYVDADDLNSTQKAELTGWIASNTYQSENFTQYIIPLQYDSVEGTNLQNYLSNPVVLDEDRDETYIYLNFSYTYTQEYSNFNPTTVFNNVFNEIITTGTWTANATGDGAIDIVGTLFEILGMPFAFISYAFNLTLFPGTPYALNISHLFLALLVSGIVIFVIKKIYK